MIDPTDFARAQVLKAIREGERSARALNKKHPSISIGKAKTMIGNYKKEHPDEPKAKPTKTEPAAVPVAPAPLQPNPKKPEKTQPTPEPLSNAPLVWQLRVIGWGLGTAGVLINGYYGFKLSDVLWQSLFWMLLGALIDLIAVLAPGWTFALGWAGAPLWLIWLLALVYSSISGMGFMAGVLGDNARHTNQVEQYAERLDAQIKLAGGQLAKLRNPATIDQEIADEASRLQSAYRVEWRTSKGCTEKTTSAVCEHLEALRKEREGEAQRIPLAATIERLSREAAALKTAGKDMAPEMVETITAGTVPLKWVYIFRSAVPAVMLAISGLLLAYARRLQAQ